MFAEGRKDRNFLNSLIGHEKFIFQASKWVFTVDSASGSAPSVILGQCVRRYSFLNYDLILCFIDLDVLKKQHLHNWEKEKEKLEKKHKNITIIWFLDSLEDEFRDVLGQQYRDKHKINKAAKKKINKFINSKLWGRILEPIRSKENILNKAAPSSKD